MLYISASTVIVHVLSLFSSFLSNNRKVSVYVIESRRFRVSCHSNDRSNKLLGILFSAYFEVLGKDPLLQDNLKQDFRHLILNSCYILVFRLERAYAPTKWPNSSAEENTSCSRISNGYKSLGKKKDLIRNMKWSLNSGKKFNRSWIEYDQRINSKHSNQNDCHG